MNDVTVFSNLIWYNKEAALILLRLCRRTNKMDLVSFEIWPYIILWNSVKVKLKQWSQFYHLNDKRISQC